MKRMRRRVPTSPIVTLLILAIQNGASPAAASGLATAAMAAVTRGSGGTKTTGSTVAATTKQSGSYTNTHESGKTYDGKVEAVRGLSLEIEAGECFGRRIDRTADRALRPERAPLPAFGVDRLQLQVGILPLEAVKIPPRYPVLGGDDRCFRPE